MSSWRGEQRCVQTSRSRDCGCPAVPRSQGAGGPTRLSNTKKSRASSSVESLFLALPVRRLEAIMVMSSSCQDLGMDSGFRSGFLSPERRRHSSEPSSPPRHPSTKCILRRKQHMLGDHSLGQEVTEETRLPLSVGQLRWLFSSTRENALPPAKKIFYRGWSSLMEAIPQKVSGKCLLGFDSCHERALLSLSLSITKS